MVNGPTSTARKAAEKGVNNTNETAIPYIKEYTKNLRNSGRKRGLIHAFFIGIYFIRISRLKNAQK